jgi:hypothetical protein
MSISKVKTMAYKGRDPVRSKISISSDNKEQTDTVNNVTLKIYIKIK